MVRAAPDKEQVRTARASLLTALGAGVVVFAIWLGLRESSAPAARQRTLSDVEVEWVCDNDSSHRKRARGGYTTIPCPQCDGKCHLSFEFECSTHGSFRALVDVDPPDPNADTSAPRRERIVRFRYESSSGAWRSTAGVVPCHVPGCRETGRPVRQDNDWRTATPSPP